MFEAVGRCGTQKVRRKSYGMVNEWWFVFMTKLFCTKNHMTARVTFFSVCSYWVVYITIKNLRFQQELPYGFIFI